MGISTVVGSDGKRGDLVDCCHPDDTGGGSRNRVGGRQNLMGCAETAGEAEVETSSPDAAGTGSLTESRRTGKEIEDGCQGG